MTQIAGAARALTKSAFITATPGGGSLNTVSLGATFDKARTQVIVTAARNDADDNMSNAIPIWTWSDDGAGNDALKVRYMKLDDTTYSPPASQRIDVTVLEFAE